MQKIVNGEKSYRQIDELLKELGCKKFMLVGCLSFYSNDIKDYFENTDIPNVVFDKFTANPKYEEVCNGVKLFNSEKCDAIVALGGGSAVDVAKCIKLFAKMDNSELYFKQKFTDNGIPLIAIPTTAGTGSESTKFSVMYYDGVKQSVSDESIIPDYVFLDSTLLYSLPIYQKKCTMLDALCQAIESWWSVNSNDESKEYSKIAIEKIINNYKGYIFDCDPKSAEEILLGSNFAGRAINLTTTTAAHAMSYKMTTLYGIPHGHAVCISLPYIWQYMINNPNECVDVRGSEYLLKTFEDIAKTLGAQTANDAVVIFENLLKELEITAPAATEDELLLLASSVNLQRLGNNPVKLEKDTLYRLYKTITKEKN